MKSQSEGFCTFQPFQLGIASSRRMAQEQTANSPLLEGWLVQPAPPG